MIGVIDYGAGNIGNVMRALAALKMPAEILRKPKDEKEPLSLLILPGVGAFPTAYRHLKEVGWTDFLKEYRDGGGAILGICLGMQMLCEGSYEEGYTPGLGFIPGEVVRLEAKPWPHIGWNELRWRKDRAAEFDAMPFEGADVYFVHGYCLLESQACIATTEVGERSFVSAVKRDSIMGFQFHPERSGKPGLALFKSAILSLTGGKGK